MKIWHLFDRDLGCLALFATFLLAFLIAYCVGWYDERATSYIDKPTAVRYALEYTQDTCRRMNLRRIVNCVNFKLTGIDEYYYGWGIEVTSVDGRRTYSMIIGRKGEYDSTGGSDMDDPEHLPKTTLIGPVQPLP